MMEEGTRARKSGRTRRAAAKGEHEKRAWKVSGRKYARWLKVMPARRERRRAGQVGRVRKRDGGRRGLGVMRGEDWRIWKKVRPARPRNSGRRVCQEDHGLVGVPPRVRARRREREEVVKRVLPRRSMRWKVGRRVRGWEREGRCGRWR